MVPCSIQTVARAAVVAASDMPGPIVKRHAVKAMPMWLQTSVTRTAMPRHLSTQSMGDPMQGSTPSSAAAAASSSRHTQSPLVRVTTRLTSVMLAPMRPSPRAVGRVRVPVPHRPTADLARGLGRCHKSPCRQRFNSHPVCSHGDICPAVPMHCSDTCQMQLRCSINRKVPDTLTCGGRVAKRASVS